MNYFRRARIIQTRRPAFVCAFSVDFSTLESLKESCLDVGASGVALTVLAIRFLDILPVPHGTAAGSLPGFFRIYLNWCISMH